MKLCMCGGRFVRHGENQTGDGGDRFHCRFQTRDEPRCPV